MSDSKNYITPQGLETLRSELSQLLHHERPKLVETVAWAASNGDRSENADYIYGKRRLREIDRRVRFLTDRIERAFVVEPSQVTSTHVVFGATVTITNEDGDEKTYQIVGEDEFDIKSGKISWRSPIAKALLGKKEGDEATIHKPQGTEIVTVEKVIYR
jgi:transcription elongation factor GreB